MPAVAIDTGGGLPQVARPMNAAPPVSPVYRLPHPLSLDSGQALEGCEIAYEIKRGELTGRIFKNPIYYGVTPRFWGNCAGIAGPEAWEMWGWFYCGKGDPGQIIFVGHGCAPTRFDNIRVGST